MLFYLSFNKKLKSILENVNYIIVFCGLNIGKFTYNRFKIFQINCPVFNFFSFVIEVIDYFILATIKNSQSFFFIF